LNTLIPGETRLTNFRQILPSIVLIVIAPVLLNPNSVVLQLREYPFFVWSSSPPETPPAAFLSMVLFHLRQVSSFSVHACGFYSRCALQNDDSA
jgi:hypothetical protein